MKHPYRCTVDTHPKPRGPRQRARRARVSARPDDSNDSTDDDDGSSVPRPMSAWATRARALARRSMVVATSASRAGAGGAATTRATTRATTAPARGATRGVVASGRSAASTTSAGNGRASTALEEFLSGTRGGAGGGGAGGGGRRGGYGGGSSSRGRGEAEDVARRGVRTMTSAIGLDPGSRIQMALAKIAMRDAMDTLGVFEYEEDEDT